MSDDLSRPPRNWFDHEGKSYARFRPEYPSQLAAFLASIAPDTQLAIDVGCGSGQMTQLLSHYFNKVVGLDKSADQIANATPNGKIQYKCAGAEKLPIADNSASLITAAQSAHWFELQSFYGEVKRIGVQDAILALISYGVVRLEPTLDHIFQNFYRNEVAPYWPPERQLVESGYAGIDFPFKEFRTPSFQIRLEWQLTEFLGYLSTWSAIRNAKEAGQDNILMAFTEEISQAWGNQNTPRSLAWPINMRIGKIL